MELTRRTKWIIVRVTEHCGAVALVVDAVTEVFGAGRSEQRSVPEHRQGASDAASPMCTRTTGRLVFVVDTAGGELGGQASLTPSTLPPLLSEGAP